MVGTGPQRDALVARAARRDVSQAFSFLGHRDDVAAQLADADIFVLPSRSEAFPNALLEAMGAGLAVVASATGGILEIVDDGRTGLLAEAGSADQLGDRLCELMADSAQAARLGEAARVAVKARFSFERMVAGFESVYLHELIRRGVIAAGAPRLAVS